VLDGWLRGGQGTMAADSAGPRAILALPPQTRRRHSQPERSLSCSIHKCERYCWPRAGEQASRSRRAGTSALVKAADATPPSDYCFGRGRAGVVRRKMYQEAGPGLLTLRRKGMGGIGAQSSGDPICSKIDRESSVCERKRSRRHLGEAEWTPALRTEDSTRCG
jgi:hypothetical protein